MVARDEGRTCEGTDMGKAIVSLRRFPYPYKAALSRATVLGLGDFRVLADQAYRRVLSLQRTDGGFEFFSQGNYGLLTDRRSYPRNLSMILCHLLSEAQIRMSSKAEPALGMNRQANQLRRMNPTFEKLDPAVVNHMIPLSRYLLKVPFMGRSW